MLRNQCSVIAKSASGGRGSRRTEGAKAPTTIRLSRSFALPKGRGSRRTEGAKALITIRLSRSFALPKGRGSRRTEGAKALTTIRLSRSFALPKGSTPVARQSSLRTGFLVDPKICRKDRASTVLSTASVLTENSLQIDCGNTVPEPPPAAIKSESTTLRSTERTYRGTFGSGVWCSEAGENHTEFGISRPQRSRPPAAFLCCCDPEDDNRSVGFSPGTNFSSSLNSQSFSGDGAEQE